MNELLNLNMPFGFKANLWEIEEPGPQRTFNTAKYDEIGTNPNIAFGGQGGLGGDVKNTVLCTV